MRRYQRGLTLIGAAIAGVALLAFLGIATAAWHNFTGSYVNEGKALQKAEDDNKVSVAQTDMRTAQGNEASCKATLATQNGDIARAQKEAGDAQLLAHKNALIAQKALADKQAAMDENRRIAAAAPQAQACEKELTESDAIGRAVARSLRGVVVTK